jgi:hypothetical protein
VGEAARGEQLIANQGQEWIGIRTMSKRSWLSNMNKECDSGERKAKGGVEGLT